MRVQSAAKSTEGSKRKKTAHQPRQLGRRQPHELREEGVARGVAARQLHRAACEQQALA